MAETPPPAPPQPPTISSRCPGCERTLRRDLDSPSPAALGRTCSSPLPAQSPPAVQPGALFRHKSDMPSPSPENLSALASRGPLFPAASPPPQFAGAGTVLTIESEEVRKLKEQMAELGRQQLKLAAEKSQRQEVICMIRKENMVEICFQCSCGRDQKVVAKIE